MPKVIFFLISCLLVTNLNAQSFANKKDKRRWALGGIHVGAGLLWGESHKSYDDIKKQSDAVFSISQPETYEADCSPYCFLTGIRPFYIHFGGSLYHKDPETKVYDRSQEWRFGIAAKVYSEVLGFKKQNDISADTVAFDAWNYRYLQFEPAIETAYLFSSTPRRLSVYAGPGIRVGIPVASRIDELHATGRAVRDAAGVDGLRIVSEDDVFRSYRLPFAVNTRICLVYGLRFNINKRLQLMLEAQSGFGFSASRFSRGSVYQTFGLGLRSTY